MTEPIVKPYKHIGKTTLNLHVIGPPNGAAGDALPAVVFFSCGGWSRFDATKFFPQSRYLASRGVVCFNAEVRVEPEHGTTPTECVVDGKSAVRWVRAHAAEFGVDPGRIAAAGGSAAGHVTACCGVIEDEHMPKKKASAMFSTKIAFVARLK